ncbi:MAG: hypothetical protein ACFN0X_08985 [Mitsuokella sp.]
MRRRRPHDGLVVFWVRLRLCQYTAIDEYTRLRYLGAFEEQNTFSSAQFLQQLVDAFPFPIRKVQTDGGTEFTKRFTKGSGHDETLFEKQLREYGIEHQKIRPCTPRHNGKVERSHRKDNEAFDASHQFDSFGISKGSWLGAIESAMHSRCVHWAGIYQTNIWKSIWLSVT